MATAKKKQNKNASLKKAVKSEKTLAQKVASEKVEKKTKEASSKKDGKSKKVKETTSKPGFFKRIKNFFHEVRKELKKVTWPSKKNMIKYSIATIVFVVFFSLFFYLIEIILAAIKAWV